MKVLAESYDSFNKYDHIKFTVSCRNKPTRTSVREFLKQEYGFLQYEQIDTAFGFTEDLVPLYGGRSFKPDFVLTDRDLQELYEDGIGLRLPMSNSFVTEEDYNNSKFLLEKHHREHNDVIVSNEQLAAWIKRDFPLYRLECSTIKNWIPTEIDHSFDSGLFDNTVLPSRFIPDPEIANIINKDKIIVFANSKCGWTCKTPNCYLQVSQHNKGENETYECSGEGGDEKVIFNIDRLVDMGFTHFKLTPVTEKVGKTLKLL